MNAITAVPCPPPSGPPDHRRPPFERRMRSVLRDDAGWAELVADPKGRNDAEQWLKTTSTSIDQQLAFRHDEVEAWALRPENPENAERLADYHAWRKGALYMKSLCEQRIIALNRLRALDESRADQAMDLLLELARAVLEHQREPDDELLHQALDRIVVPGENGSTLRQKLQSRETAHD